jgi:hypothetical protein
MIQAPPYALETPVFRFKALVSHAGRAALGGDREIALACFAVARLGLGLLPPFMLAPGDAATRIANTVTTNNKRTVVHAVSGLIEACVRHLDQSSVAELHELMTELG